MNSIHDSKSDYQKYADNDAVNTGSLTIRADEEKKDEELSSIISVESNQGRKKNDKEKKDNAQKELHKKLDKYSKYDIEIELEKTKVAIDSLQNSVIMDLNYKKKMDSLILWAILLEKELAYRESLFNNKDSMKENDYKEQLAKDENRAENESEKMEVEEEENESVKEAEKNVEKEENKLTQFTTNNEDDITQNGIIEKKIELVENNNISKHFAIAITNVIKFIFIFPGSILSSKFKDIFNINYNDLHLPKTNEEIYELISEKITLGYFLEEKIGKEMIEHLLKLENENENAKIKIINVLFSTELEEIFNIYLFDSPFLLYNGFKMYLEGLKTFKDNFNRDDEKRIIEIREDIVKLLKRGSKNEVDNSSSNCLPSNPLINHSSEEKKSNIVLEISSDEGIKSNYNKRKLIINACSKEITIFIGNLCKKYKILIHKLTISSQLGENFEEFRDFFNKKIAEIYKDFKPRRLPKENKEYDFTIKEINKAIEKEDKIEKEENKILHKIFKYATFGNFLITFLDDLDFITCKDEYGNIIIFKIEEFRTYKNCLNNFSEPEKDAYKEDMKRIISGKKGRKEKKEKNI